MILSVDMIVLGKFALGSYVPGSKNMKYELHLDLDSGLPEFFERTAGEVTPVLPSVQPGQQGAGDQDVAPISPANPCAGDKIPAPTHHALTANPLSPPNLSVFWSGQSLRFLF
jgi:hypothetical protein